MQEVIGSTPIFSTQTINSPDLLHVSIESGLYPGITPPNLLSFPSLQDDMKVPAKLYTEPILNKGKEVKAVPKGSTKAVEQSKLTWYVDFSFYNTTTGKLERFRKTNNGNRIKDPKEKLRHFTGLLAAYKELLESGYNPLDERSNENLKKSIVSVTLKEAKDRFVEYHQAKGTRRKSIQTYISKIKYFIDHIGDTTKVVDVTDYDITAFLNHFERTKQWSGVTFNLARISLNNFFTYLKVNKYIAINPVTDIETRKELPTESHQVFTDEDFKLIMEWLTDNDTFTLFFVRMIYYTCIRPNELRHLQLKHISLRNGTITVPATIAKNKKSTPVSIDPSLEREFTKLNISAYPDTFFLLGSPKSIVSKSMIGTNHAYNRFMRCLDELKLQNKGYTLYSFKHMSNISKYKAGWTIAEICAANRHSSLVETETYLKDLLKFVKTEKLIPPI
jgi:integrase